MALGSVSFAAAKTPVQEKGDLVKLELSELLQSLGKAEEDAVAAEAALVIYSRREFCKAVEGWTMNYMDRSGYKSGKSEIYDKNLIKLIPPSVGTGEFFENVVVGLITKGCLTPEERRAYFEEYKVRVLRYYLGEIEWALGEIEKNKAGLIREERGAMKEVEIARDYALTVEAFYEQGKEVNYENIFNDDSKEVAVDFTKGSHYRKVVAFIKSLESEGGKDRLSMVSEKMDTTWELYNHEATPETEKQDLLNAYMLLQEYQVKLMHDAIPNPGRIASETVDEGGVAVGETEFSAILKDEGGRTFNVPELDMDKELQNSRVLVADGDNKWLRIAELAYFTYAVEKLSEHTVVGWEESLNHAGAEFANLPAEYTGPLEYRDSETPFENLQGAWTGTMRSYLPGSLMQYPQTSGEDHMKNGYDFTTLYDRERCNYDYDAPDVTHERSTYEWCIARRNGLADNTDHLVEAYIALPGLRPSRVQDLGGTTTDVPQMLLRKLAREHIAAIIEGK